MRMIQLLVFLLVAACTYSGTRYSEINLELLEDSVKMEVTGEMKFGLDSASTARNSGVQTYPSSDPRYLIFQHTATKTISVFDIKNGELKSKIIPEIEGPNGVGKGISGMYFHNFDSIFLLSVLEQRLYLIDSASQLIEKYDLNSYDFYVHLGSPYPAFIKDNFLYLCTYTPPINKPTSDHFSTIRLNLSNKLVEQVFNLSDEYDKGWWGKHGYLRASHNYNSQSDIIVLSFPNDHFVYSIDKMGRRSKHFAGAKNIKKMKPISKEIEDINDDDRMYRNEAKQGRYYFILFDSWRKVYYRFSFNPAKGEYESPFDIFKNVSIVILDINFKKIGEHYLEKDTYSLYSYITPSGLHLFNQAKYNTGEDNLVFDTFEVKPIVPAK